MIDRACGKLVFTLVSDFDLSFAINCFSTEEKGSFLVEVDVGFGGSCVAGALPNGGDDDDITTRHSLTLRRSKALTFQFCCMVGWRGVQEVLRREKIKSNIRTSHLSKIVGTLSPPSTARPLGLS